MNISNVISYFRRNKSAQTATNRLHIIIAQEKFGKNAPDYLPMLRQEILRVVAKYTQADLEKVNVEFHQKDNNAILELNITLPDGVAATV